MGVILPGFDYANARLHAMKSRLLSQQQLYALAEIDNDEGLLIALTQTPYQPAVEAAMVRASGLEATNLALRQDLIQTVSRIRTFFSSHERDTLSVVLRSYDVHNLKVILRSVDHHIPAAERMSAMLPIGDLNETVLSTLANASSSREVIDLLASIRAPIAQPLLRLRNEKPNADLFDQELAIERWHVSDAFARLETSPRSEDLLSAALALHADLTNLLTVIRLVHAPGERAVLRQQLGENDFGSLWVGPGRLSFTMLQHAAEQSSLDAAVDSLAKTTYRDALEEGMQAYRQTGQLSSFEKALARKRLAWMTKLLIKDPLGIGVLLGYLALKVNEVSNLRWIAQAIHAGLSAGQIHQELEVC